MAPAVEFVLERYDAPGPLRAEVLARIGRTGVVRGIQPFTLSGPDLPRFPEQKCV
jgi:hypothetical protein